MLRRLVLSLIVLAGPLAYADEPADTPFDPTLDECAAPDSGCLLDAGDPTDAELELDELAAPEDLAPIDWPAAIEKVACPEGSTAQDGACVPGVDAIADMSGGCTTSALPGLLVAGAVVILIAWARRRRALLIALAACSLDAGSYDDAVDNGPTGDANAYVDVYSAERGDDDGAQFVLEHQPIATGALEPTAQFSLLRERAELPVFRIAGSCGDRLATIATDGASLLGWASASAGDGTAELVELAAPDGCAFAYEIESETIDTLVAQGYQVTGTVGHVWPPGMGERPAAETDEAEPVSIAAAPAPCHVTKKSALQLLYASPGADYTTRFLHGCPGEVVIGEKRESGPVGRMKDASAKAAGGRTAFVLDRHGDKLRELLLRSNGVERTAAYLRKKMRQGYDYIVIDEITAAPDFRDGTTLNRRLRKLLLRMPTRTIIPYISIDLVQQPNGFAALQGRRLLMRAFKKRARVLALEVYLHTPQVRAGAAPATFRRAADRLALSVKGLKDGGGINQRAISIIGTSIHAGGSGYPQYMYLDQPSYDLRSLSRQVNAIRHGSRRLRQQNGVGWYFVYKSDMNPRGGVYSYDALIRRMRLLALRFK